MGQAYGKPLGGVGWGTQKHTFQLVIVLESSFSMTFGMGVSLSKIFYLGCLFWQSIKRLVFLSIGKGTVGTPHLE